MSASRAITATPFKVGRCMVVFSAPRPAAGELLAMVIEWSEPPPERPTRKERRQYEAGARRASMELARLVYQAAKEARLALDGPPPQDHYEWGERPILQ